MDDPRYSHIWDLLFAAQIQEYMRGMKPRLGGEERIKMNALFVSPQFKIHEQLSEKMFKVIVNCRLTLQAGSDGRMLHADEDFKTFTRQVGYGRLFDLVNEAFGEDALVS